MEVLTNFVHITFFLRRNTTYLMKAKFALMLALASSLSFVACSDDDDDAVSQIVTSATEYIGTTTASVMGVEVPMENDVLTVAPMEKDANYAQITLAARELSFGLIAVTMDAFTIDSLTCTGTADDYALTRAKAFAIEGINVSLAGQESAQVISGTFDGATVKDGVLKVSLSGVKAHEAMPEAITISMSFEGQKK